MVLSVKQEDRVFETGFPNHVGEMLQGLEVQIRSGESIYVLSELQDSIHGMSDNFRGITLPFREMIFKNSMMPIESSGYLDHLRDSIIFLSDLVKFLTTLEKPPLALEAPLVLHVFFDNCRDALETLTTPKALKQYSYFIYKHSIFYDLTAELNFLDTAYNMWCWDETYFEAKAPMKDFQNVLRKRVSDMVQPLRSILVSDWDSYKDGPYGVWWHQNVMWHFQNSTFDGDDATEEEKKFKHVSRSEIHSLAMAYIPGFVGGLYRDLVSSCWPLSEKWSGRDDKEYHFIDFLEDAPQVLPW